MMVRIMIVLLLLGSAFLGWNYTRQAKLLERYETELAPKGRVSVAVVATQNDAHRYASGLKQAEDENISSTADEGVVLRIRKVAQGKTVLWGGIYSSKARAVQNSVGKKKYVDTVYRIKHEDNKHTVDRTRIAHLFYLLEGLRNLHVTGIEISPSKSPKPGQIPADDWTCEFEVRQRAPKPKG